MFEGQLVGIYKASRKGERLAPADQGEVVAGQGLVGDRYFLKSGTYSAKGGVDRELTLIESEALEALAKETEIKLDPAEARRNLLTKDVPLNHLVGKEFRVGDVVLRGIRLCEPCGHLEKLTVSGVEKGLCHRGGLRAQIIKGGGLKVGDRIAFS